MKKVIISIIAASLLAPSTISAFAGEYYGFTPMPDVQYSDLEMKPVTEEEVNAVLTDIKNAVSGKDTKKLEDSLTSIEALADRQAQAYALANIRTSQHNTEENNALTDNMYASAINMSKKIMKLITELSENPFFASGMANELGGEDVLKELIETQPTDKTYELANKEQELISKYNSMLPESMTFTDENGDSYTFESVINDVWGLLEKNISDFSNKEDADKLQKEYEMSLKRYTAALKEMSEKLGELYKEMVNVRTDIAKEAGYDNYADYAYEMVYARDFTTEDAKKLYAAVKKYIVPLQGEFPTDDYFYDRSVLKSNDDIIQAVRRTIDNVNPELTESFDYMTGHGFLDICSNEDRVTPGTGYTTELYNSAPPFIFISAVDNNTSFAYSTLIHEFGHYNAILRKEQGESTGLEDLLSSSNSESIDLQEVFSQGLEMLSANNYTETFDLTDSSKMYTNRLADMIYSIVTGCMFDEWQCEIYKNPNMSIDEINSLYGKLLKEYELYSNSEYEGLDSDLTNLIDMEINTGWMQVPHNFTAPMYYISYATSAAASVDLWSQSVNDYPSAVDKYMTLTANDYDGLSSALSAVGMDDIFNENTIKKISDSVTSYLTGGYSDVTTSSWYTSAARFTKPYFDNSQNSSLFRPGENTTRREAAQTLASLNQYTTGIAAEGKSEFQDAPNSPLISWTADAGIIKGYDENTFAPDDTLTREQAVTIIYRYCQHELLGTEEITSPGYDNFKDKDEVCDWAKEAFQWAYAHNIINGRPKDDDIILAPHDTLTRAEFAQMLTNMADEVNLNMSRG